MTRTDRGKIIKEIESLERLLPVADGSDRSHIGGSPYSGFVY